MILSFVHAQNLLAKEEKNLNSRRMHGGFYMDNAKIVLIERNSTNGNKIDLNINKIIQFKNLEISLISCWQSENEKKDYGALILVEEFFNLNDPIAKVIERNKNKKLNQENENKKKGESQILFYGWIFSKYKYINHMNHQIFDLWLDKCF
jgi:hypothetical protein